MFFFFKQKTAYEILALLECRRVLFRSAHELGGSLHERARHHEPRLGRGLRERGPGVGVEGDGVLVGGEHRVEPRSEERRVGKERRSRGSPYHLKTHTVYTSSASSSHVV